MGCVPSKFFRKHLKQDHEFINGDCAHHVVHLTSSTYGVLKLDQEKVVEMMKSPPREDLPEIINAWELMKDLEDEIPIWIEVKKSPKSTNLLRRIWDIDMKTPSKVCSRSGSPRKSKKFGGKENSKPRIIARLEYSPKGVLKDTNSLRNGDLGFSPIFDRKLVASFEKEILEENEEIKKMVSVTPKVEKAKNLRQLNSFLESFPKKCPPGGENAVVIYTTTLRGIRRTFEDCNNVRSIIESYNIQMFERDVSMDSGFKEELRGLMVTYVVKVPLVFVKGRFIGGAEELIKLEEEGKLGILFDGISRAVLGGCDGCAGVRFVMCMDCNGSCKVLNEEENEMVRCGECNENGLIQCPICC